MNNKAALEFDKLIAIIIAVVILGIIIAFIVLNLNGMLDGIGGFGSGTIENLNDTASGLDLLN